MVAVSDSSVPIDCIAVSPSDVEDSSSTASTGSYIDYGQVRLYHESRENSEVDAESEEDSGDEEEEEVVVCEMCGQTPCDWETFGEEIWEECQGLKQQGLDNNAIRYHAYRMYTRLRHGVLRRNDRRPLPVCVRGEIMDEWPDPNHEYVGFQAALRDATTES